MPASAEYAARLEQYGARRDSLYKQFIRIGNARLAAAIAGVILAFFVFGVTSVSPWWLLVPGLIFLALVVVHARIVERLGRTRRSIAFFEGGVARLENRWQGRGETGERYRNPQHVYADDLDLFGRASLFELLCTARTRAGQDAVATWLLAPAAPDEVRRRHEIVGRLRERLAFREHLAVLGEELRSEADPVQMASWAEQAPIPFPAGARVIAFVLGAATLVTFCLYMAGTLHRYAFIASLLLTLLCGQWLRARSIAAVRGIDHCARDLALFRALLSRIEGERFESNAARELQQRIRGAALHVRRLERLLVALDQMHNMFFALIGIAVLWTPQMAMAIEHWRRKHGRDLRGWIAVAGEFEALSALATYSFEHENDPFPELLDAGSEFQAEGLGHPLMPETSFVRNDVALGSGPQLLVVSGSNMSGKSTLLRSVGLNTVLALAGAPVRARRLVLSPLQTGASLRTVDSLQDGRSRFYAEITRLRQILDLAAGETPALFLIDELLSGTNSHDRRIGAQAILTALLDRGAIGMVTTHDLALAEIAPALGTRAVNVHFEDTILQGKLVFDYQLRPGVVEHSNALELMRSVGLIE